MYLSAIQLLLLSDLCMVSLAPPLITQYILVNHEQVLNKFFADQLWSLQSRRTSAFTTVLEQPGRPSLRILMIAGRRQTHTCPDCGKSRVLDCNGSIHSSSNISSAFGNRKSYRGEHFIRDSFKLNA
ncbi:hypothetical protein EDD36DRAFT_432893 [Exophiala viscosa]|uniref:Secreted protein n=1 Tax=Exophiala viscosa TaxID=2486360 RepID=A0AAN6DZH9_9EURO|nr:hypothetical protein EDD36DRAFT_432893 [Exophiala viscosa]